MHHADRGFFELRQGRVLLVTAPEEVVLIAAVESVTHETLIQLGRLSRAPLRLVLTHHRAIAMGIGEGLRLRAETSPLNGRNPDVSLGLPPDPDPDQILRLASAVGKHPSRDLDLRAASKAESGGLALARLGRFLPAVIVAPVDMLRAPELLGMLEEGEILRVTAEQVAAAAGSRRVGVIPVSDAHVPLSAAAGARFMLFREGNGFFEHLAVLIGDPTSWPDPLPIRLHSACITGDLFGSLRCDCGEQLARSLSAFAERGGGVLLYLAHEGRSIGLANKLRAYAIQEEGLDTVDADCALGFGSDERCYDAALDILRFLGIERVELLTNNPDKLRAMEEGGIRVVRRRALHGTLTPQNLPYMSAKALRTGHWLEGMLSRPLPAPE